MQYQLQTTKNNSLAQKLENNYLNIPESETMNLFGGKSEHIDRKELH